MQTVRSPRAMATAGAQRRASPRAWVVAAAWVVLAMALPAQEPQRPGELPPTQDRYLQHDGKVVRAVRFSWINAAGDARPDGGQQYSVESLLRQLGTQANKPFSHATVSADVQTLWSNRSLICPAYFVEEVDGGVEVVFVVIDSHVYGRIEFRGLEHLTEEELRADIALDARRGVNDHQATTLAKLIEERYRRDGYAYVEVDFESDLAANTLTFFVDEGPEVLIRDVYFRGNASFPAWAPLGLFDNLIGSSGMRSEPGVFFGAPYSPDVVDDDLGRLRVFYRSQGYLDAVVELAAVDPSEDLTTVDLTIVVFEGRRYRIGSIDLEQTPPPDREQPQYAKQDVLAVTKLRAGDFYEQARVDLDKAAIEDFYGSRGHPSVQRHGRGLQNAFSIRDPIQVYDYDRAEVHLVHSVVEGTPKTLRDVVIHGNQFTRDHVIRRDVFALPGERLDMTQVERSLRRLDGRQYFQDPVSLAGVSFTLLPVPGDEDVVDLDVGVTEGDTGELRWGGGVSTSFGAQAQFSLTKRNFDISRVPSSPNPLTVIGEIMDQRAFHGGGQELELMLAPGTEISLFRLSFYDPDIFGNHFDTWGLHVRGHRLVRYFGLYRQDSLAAEVGLERNFTPTFSVGITAREESVEVENPAPNAPTIVFDSEGRTELRGLRLTPVWRSLDHPLRPTDGYDLRVYGEIVGGPLGGEESFWKGGTTFRYYYPVYTDARERAHVLAWRHSFEVGRAFGSSDDVFLTERWYMGGSTLRGFDQRRAGPVQFGQPLGGEARLLASLEYEYPLVSSRRQGEYRETEFIRGVLFSDFGMLGTQLDDPTFAEPRVSAGLGVRIYVPVLGLPLALYLGWPIVDEDTDRQRQVYFTLGR